MVDKILHISLACVLFLALACQDSRQESRPRGSLPCQANLVDPDDTSRIVCECTVDYCDNLVFDWPKSGELLQIVSSKSGKRFHLAHNKIDCGHRDLSVIIDPRGNKICERIKNGKRPSSDEYVLHLSLTKLYQEIMGFGGAFTDAAVLNMHSLPDKLKDVIVDNYYGDKGLQYSIARVPIGGTDFSTHAYSYDDSEEQDVSLSNWKLTDEDTNYKIPYMKKAIQLYKNRTGQDMKIFASPWSPPKWMKTNNAFERGFLRGTSSESGLIYSSYASYLVKFLEAYKKNGINLWGMTLQNEPGMAYLPIYFFNSLQFSASDQVNFIKYHLGPQLVKYGYTKDKFKLIIGDDSIGVVNQQVDKIMADKIAKSYVSGLGIHWYMSEMFPLNLINLLYKKHKHDIEFILSTESCNGWRPSDIKVVLGDWSRGIAYFNDIIETINRNVNGWIDWNLALDLKGGPNWSGNFVDAPIIVDSDNKKLYKNPMFYVLGHFSRFVPPGSRRVHNKLTCHGPIWDVESCRWKHKVKLGTFVTPSNHLIVVLANLSNLPTSIGLKSIVPNNNEVNNNEIIANYNQDFSVELEGDSVTTLVYGLNSETIKPAK